jgi:restriction system protein
MPVPDFQSLMLPLLRIAADGKEHPLSVAREPLAREFKLTESDQQELLPSGRQSKFTNRVAWAKTYLQQAGLLLSPRRGYFQISPRGAEVLNASPPRIDIKFLEQYAEFTAFRAPRAEQVSSDQQPPEHEPETPEETLEVSYLKIKASLASELLVRVKAASPQFFERLVVELLRRMHYGDVGQVIGRSGDEGIDGTISQDQLGLDIIYLQAKRWDGTVGRPEIQKFVGALHGQRAKKGVFITTGSFSSEAISYAAQIDPKVVLIDGRKLTELMINFGVGVSTVTTYNMRRVDSDYFDEA